MSFEEWVKYALLRSVKQILSQTLEEAGDLKQVPVEEHAFSFCQYGEGDGGRRHRHSIITVLQESQDSDKVCTKWYHQHTVGCESF